MEVLQNITVALPKISVKSGFFNNKGYKLIEEDQEIQQYYGSPIR